jgi:hypothetical protein
MMARRRRVALLALGLVLGGWSVGARAQEEVAPRRTRPAAARAGAGDALLRQIAEAQRALGDQLQNVQERLDAVQSDAAARADQLTGVEQEVKALREEVKGLYVESSTLKQQMDGLKEDFGAFDSRLEAFRFFAGFFMAAMAIALFVIFMLAARR